MYATLPLSLPIASTNLHHRINPPTRLRRAIHLNSPTLVSRLLRTHPHLVQNPDFTSKANTNLHLAASLGYTSLAEILLHAGHESGGLSRNADHDTPLMLAAKNGHIDVGKLLIRECPEGIGYANAQGLDALGLASQNPSSTALIPVLLNAGASVEVWDLEGNSPLHHASASGSLKALRILLAAGANPLAKNSHDWTALAYSQTVAAEVYFRNLVAELERRRVEGLKAEEEIERQRAAGVRVVADEEAEDHDTGATSGNETGASSFPKRSVDAGGSLAPPGWDEDEVIGDALKRHWSPTHISAERNMKARPLTPSGGKTPTHEWDNRLLGLHTRTRSGSGNSR